MSMIDRTRGVRIGVTGTPIPRRDLTVNGPSEVRKYMLSSEELEEIRVKYPPTKRDKNFTKPIEIKPKPKKEEDVMPRGRKPKNAEQPVLREKDTTVQLPVSQDLLGKAEREIERLTAELAESKAANYSQSAIIERMKRDLESSGKEASNLRANLEEQYKYMDKLQTEIDRLQAEKTSLEEIERILKYEVEQLRSDLLKLRGATPEETGGQRETELLDAAIADLNRARWILDRLTP